jgi:GT2 family glycosyltransferase
MMVRREAIDKAGMMPTCFFLYYEELDWSMMMTRAGYDIWYEPACTIFHKEFKASASPVRQRMRMPVLLDCSSRTPSRKA